MFLGKELAMAELAMRRVDQVLAAIGKGDPRTARLFLAEVQKRDTPTAQLLYCRDFFIHLEEHRVWADKYLWFIPEK